jgi:hypothetical protein
MPESIDARFKLTNARVTRINERPKVCFFTVLCQCGKYPSYYDVVLFKPPEFQLTDGLAVTISGELSMAKPKEGGDGKWKLQLVARTIVQGDDNAAPHPRSGKRNDNEDAGF